MRPNKRVYQNQKKSRGSSRCQFFRPSGEWLESRRLLAVLAQFSSGDLTIGIDDGSPAEVTVDSGAVLVNGVSPQNLDSAADPVLAADVQNIRVTATGNFSNAISLQAVTAADFPNFQSATVNAGPGAAGPAPRNICPTDNGPWRIDRRPTVPGLEVRRLVAGPERQPVCFAPGPSVFSNGSIALRSVPIDAGF